MKEKDISTSKNPILSFVLDWFDSIVVGFAVIMVLFVFFFRVATVYQHSMEPTLQEKDKLLLQCSFYTPQQGDIVVIDGYTEYGKPLVKRVIALAGDTVDIDSDTGVLYVNGEALQEAYINVPTTAIGDVQFPVTVPQGTAFVLGDNRPNSTDSRSSAVGCVDTRDILGRVLMRIYPFSKIEVLA